MRTMLRALLVIVLTVISFREIRAEPTPKVELVAPGIWRIRLGKPEKFTPTFFRAAPIDREGLKRLSAIGEMPLNARGIEYTVSSHGCAVRLPLTADESIYGFGLNTELFDMTQTTAVRTGRRVFLKPTDRPENDLGESHAPVPFYVSSGGHGVFVDTARFASFYTGDVAPVAADIDLCKISK